MNSSKPKIFEILFSLMLRAALVLFLILIFWGCGVIPNLREGSESAFIRLPFVRVLLDSSKPELTLGSKSFAVECVKDGKSQVYYSTQPVIIKQVRGKLSVWIKKDLIDNGLDEIIVLPRRKNGLVKYLDKRYRGMIKILPYGTSPRVINIVHVDDYLRGVVPPELGKVSRVEMEAIKAQAVAARTYSISHLSQYPNEPYDMKSDVSDQVYYGVDAENPIISEAIEETRGRVLKYNDKLINAYYHSTCGGHTENVEEVWDKKDMPYLKTVADSGYCSWSKYYNWKESYNAQQLKARIEYFLSSEKGRVVEIPEILDIVVNSKTNGGRVAELIVKTTGGNYGFGKDKIRWVFKRSSEPEKILQSAGFSVRTEHNQQGRLVRADFIGHGYGHGVGMCQCGALGMSRAGKKYEDILTHYYTGAEIVKLY